LPNHTGKSSQENKELINLIHVIQVASRGERESHGSESAGNHSKMI